MIVWSAISGVLSKLPDKLACADLVIPVEHLEIFVASDP